MNLLTAEKISKSYLKTVSAYSNYKNGKIIFGINDEGKVIGLEKVMENINYVIIKKLK